MRDWVHRQREDGHIADDIDHGIRQPLRFAVDTGLVYDCLVPVRVNGCTLEDGNEDIGETPGGKKGNPAVADAAKDRLDEDAKVETEERDLVDGDDDFVYDLGTVEPLSSSVINHMRQCEDHTLRALARSLRAMSFNRFP